MCTLIFSLNLSGFNCWQLVLINALFCQIKEPFDIRTLSLPWGACRWNHSLEEPGRLCLFKLHTVGWVVQTSNLSRLSHVTLNILWHPHLFLQPSPALWRAACQPGMLDIFKMQTRCNKQPCTDWQRSRGLGETQCIWPWRGCSLGVKEIKWNHLLCLLLRKL